MEDRPTFQFSISYFPCSKFSLFYALCLKLFQVCLFRPIMKEYATVWSLEVATMAVQKYRRSYLPNGLCHNSSIPYALSPFSQIVSSVPFLFNDVRICYCKELGKMAQGWYKNIKYVSNSQYTMSQILDILYVSSCLRSVFHPLMNEYATVWILEDGTEPVEKYEKLSRVSQILNTLCLKSQMVLSVPFPTNDGVFYCMLQSNL
ncbi:uncharacterized protein LOC143360176 [Halictus rubicundus]|uniref:uncharacterized protein LOC143360176 n=1 Tax=Halictus rubicundus TaxID=77578 RepID=UPI004035BEFA